MKNSKLSLADFKAKAGQAFINMDSVNGGSVSKSTRGNLLDDCHLDPIVLEPVIIKTDNA